MTSSEPGAPLPSIVFVNRFYWPDESATAQLLTDLAEDMAARGWDVSVITSDSGYRETSVALPRRAAHNGVWIERVRTTRAGRLRLAARAFDAALFALGALTRLLFGRRRDVVVALTDPPMLVVPSLLAARVRGMRCVCWCQDVFPEIAASVGVLDRGGLLYRALAAVAARAHASCDLIVALGDRMAQHLVGAGADRSRVAVVHNWTHVGAVRPVPPERNVVARKLGVAGKFVLLYSGNAGRAHAFESVIVAAHALRDDPEVVFLFVGGGPRISELRAAAHALPNVRFADHVPRAELSDLLSVASASLVTERREVVGLIVPSKTYGILASGRPVLYVGDAASDVAALVRNHACGAVLDADDDAGIVETIRRWKSDPAEREAVGARAREAAHRYDRAVATAAWAALLTELVDYPDRSGTGAAGAARAASIRGSANTAPTSSQKNAATR